MTMDPGDDLFRKMLTLSGVFHVLAFIASLVWLNLGVSPMRITPVTVVDLVGAGQFAAPEENQAPPQAQARARKGARKKASPPPSAKRVKRGPPPETARRAAVSPSDSEAVSERIREIREEKASKTNVREAVETIKREKAVRAAVKGIGDRVAHRLDLSAVRPPARKAAAGAQGGMPGAAGTAKVPPEILAYARALDEKVRSNWTVPELAEKEAGALMVQVRITIEKDGRVSNVRMEKDSGNPYFDDSILRAIEKASPLPVPPERLRGGEDHYDVGFRFHGGSDR